MVVALDQGVDLALKRLTAPIMGMIEFTDATAPPYFHLRPNADVVYSGFAGKHVPTRVRINALGLRDRDRPIDKRAGVRRIVAIGDSFTFGLGVEVDESCPAQLERAFHDAGRREVEVWNAGTPGHTLADHLGSVRTAIAQWHPDLVLLQVFADDAHRPFPVAPWLAKVIHYSGLAKLYFALRMIAAEDSTVFQNTYTALIEDCRRANIPVAVWVAEYPPDTKEFIEAYNREHGIQMLSLERRPISRLEQDIHLDAAGNRECAELLFALTNGMV